MRLVILHIHNLLQRRQRRPDPRAGHLQCTLRNGRLEEFARVGGVRCHRRVPFEWTAGFMLVQRLSSRA